MNQQEEFHIELAPPLTDKLSKLKEFIDEHDLLGTLDKRYLQQFLSQLEESTLRVTKFKASVKKVKDGAHTRFTWTTAFTINNKKDFMGEAADFAEAFLRMVESCEVYLIRAAAN